MAKCPDLQANCSTIVSARKNAYGKASRSRAEQARAESLSVDNGDVSLAAGESEVEVADVLDEVDNPDGAELMQLDHAIAVHFKLGTRPGEEGTLPLRFEDMSEQLESSICERAYPVYNEVRAKTDPTIKELTEALKHEKNPIYRKAPGPSANPSVAALQDELQMPRVVLEHLADPRGDVDRGYQKDGEQPRLLL